MTCDPIGVIEACYAPAADVTAWLDGILRSLRPYERGMGSAAWTFSMKGGRLRCGELRDRFGLPPAVMTGLAAYWESAPKPVIKRFYCPAPPMRRASQIARGLPLRDVADLLKLFQASGVTDAAALVAREPGGMGVAITIPWAGRKALSTQAMHQLGSVSAHLSTALRLRERLGRPSDCDAILDPHGRLHHLEGELKHGRAHRESLTRAVRAVEAARGRLREEDPEKAIRLWRCLIEGRWSLVDSVETDGKRFVLARRNHPDVRDPKALAPAERHVLAFAAIGHSNKQIAYLLGRSQSVVAALLSSGMRKLGLNSRVEVVRNLGPLVDGDPLSSS